MYSLSPRARRPDPAYAIRLTDYALVYAGDQTKGKLPLSFVARHVRRRPVKACISLMRPRLLAFASASA